MDWQGERESLVAVCTCLSNAGLCWGAQGRP